MAELKLAQIIFSWAITKKKVAQLLLAERSALGFSSTIQARSKNRKTLGELNFKESSEDSIMTKFREKVK